MKAYRIGTEKILHIEKINLMVTGYFLEKTAKLMAITFK